MLAEAFSASFQEVQWVVLAYLFASTTLIISVGRLGDIIGRRRLLLAGILLFTVAFILCGVAPTLWPLIAAGAAQGLGAAIMMALRAFVGETVPKARNGRAMGLLGTMSAIGTALGPDGRCVCARIGSARYHNGASRGVATGMRVAFGVAASLIILARAVAVGSRTPAKRPSLPESAS